ncbi:MAG TPA: aminotransferase class I/II-fold pyridoxal phosphate-dependent enzyme [Solirubrobacteraceae bacterium]|jgi:histidinol-phosphate aminotransferase
MGLLDYYKQFEAVPEEEINRELREQAAERKARELMKIEELDLSQTIWPEPPHSDVVGAVTFVARRGLNRYPRSSELVSELAHRNNVDESRIAIGNGASELLIAATAALMRPGQTLISPWPSYPLFPVMARRAHGEAVPVAGGDVDALLEAVGQHDTRVIALASPNDPTGELLAPAELERLLASLPESVAVLLDESLIEYAGEEASESAVQLLADYPRLLVFRSFSKAWGLAGMRCGYVICGEGAEELLPALAPEHGLSELSQGAALESLRNGERRLARQVATIAAQRERLTKALRERDFEVAESSANFVWAAHSSVAGGDLAVRLRSSGVLVAPGVPLGEPRHVRITIRDAAATDRLLNAIDSALS